MQDDVGILTFYGADSLGTGCADSVMLVVVVVVVVVVAAGRPTAVLLLLLGQDRFIHNF